MIGVPTGSNIGQYVVDIDAGLDAKTGRRYTAEEILADLEAVVGESLADIWRSRTPRGGLHLFFDLPPGQEVRNRTGIRPRVDVRGEGGYVIVPPSMREDGTPYVWEIGPMIGNRETLEPVIQPLEDLRSPVAEGVQSSRPSSSPAPAYGDAALASEINELKNAAPGTRNDSLFRSSIRLGQLVGAKLLDEGVARGALASVAREWPNQRKSKGTIESGFVRGLREPRKVAEQDRAQQRLKVTADAGERAVLGHMTETLGLLEEEQRAFDRLLALLAQTDLGNAERLAARMRAI